MAEKVPYSSLDTPAVLVDMDRLEANIREMSHLAAEAGLRLRPHTKIHECTNIAKLQIEAGACGISLAKLEEAERMAEDGIDDIMIVHPFYGELKLEKLKRLLSQPKLKVSVVVDMIEQAEGISHIGQAVGKKVPVLLEIDTGVRRYGVLPGEPTLNLAKKLCQLAGIKFVGILTHEFAFAERTADGIDRLAFEVASVMAETAKMLRRERIAIEHVVVGASPTFRAMCRYARHFPEITEIHPGGMAIGDITYVNAFGQTEDTCAVTVLTTVVSTPTSDRAVIDAGAKTFGADPLIHLRWKPNYFLDGRPSYGYVKGHPDLWLGRLSAEVGVVYLTDPERKLSIGERLEIVPNNAILVLCLHDEIYGVQNNVVEKVIPVTGRGRGN